MVSVEVKCWSDSILICVCFKYWHTDGTECQTREYSKERRNTQQLSFSGLNYEEDKTSMASWGRKEKILFIEQDHEKGRFVNVY